MGHIFESPQYRRTRRTDAEWLSRYGIVFLALACCIGYISRPFLAGSLTRFNGVHQGRCHLPAPCTQPAFPVAQGVYAVPELLAAQQTCSAPEGHLPDHLHGQPLRGANHLRGLAYQVGPFEVVRGPMADSLPPPSRTALEAAHPYQRRNLRNFLLFFNSHISGHPEWLDWCNNEHQGVNCFVEEEHSFISGAPPLTGNVLDYGAEPDGAQLSLLKQWVHGQVVGFNIQRLFSAHSFQYPQHNVSFVFGPEGQRLPFPDATFDFVVSMNVLEHVLNPALYLSEAVRVLKPGGWFYLNWVPSWTSPRGHHLHREMVRGWALELGCNVSTAIDGFEYDGTTVPDWSHLLLDKHDFEEMLQRTMLGSCQPLVDRAVSFVFEDENLNRVPYETIISILRGIADIHIEKVFADQFDEDTFLSAETFQSLRATYPNITHFRLQEIVLLGRRCSMTGP